MVRSIPIRRKFKYASMIAQYAYLENLALASVAVKNIPGAVIECGTWKGGMAAGLVEACGWQRAYYFFDSFEGLPPAKAIDGVAALNYQKNVGSISYRDNCKASIEEFNKVIERTSLPQNNLHVIKGFFENTFPTVNTAKIGPIAVLRLDADWYDSTMQCLEKFWNTVVVGGIVLIDDYYTWEGCTKAVNEFFARTDPPQCVRQGPIGRVAYIIKQGASARPEKKHASARLLLN
jgi:O-methyltransferase